MDNLLEKKLVLNKIDYDNLKINKEKLYNDYIILKLNILNDDKNIKYYNFQSLLFGDKDLEDFLSKKLQSVFKEDRTNFYMLISKDTETNINAIINLIKNNSQNKELISNINISNYFLNTGDEYILLNLFLNSLPKKLSSSNFINSLGECNYFIEELRDDKKIRFLKFSVNQEYLLLNNIVTYMEAKYYLDNNKNGDKLDDEKFKEQKYFFISENNNDHFIKSIFPKKETLEKENNGIYMKKAYLDKDNPVGKASIRVHSFNVNNTLPQKNKVIESMLKNFSCYFSEYVELKFIKLKKDQYKLYEVKDFKEFSLAEEDIIKSHLSNRQIIFIDTINNDLSKKWIDFQVDLLTKGELVQRRDKDKTIFYRDMFGNAKNLFLVNPENIRIVSYDDFKFEDKNAYHILLTYKKEDYSFMKEEDPYIRKHGQYIIQTQNIGTYLNDYAKEIKKKNKNFVCEYNSTYYDVIINKDIARQTLYSLIIEDNLTNEKTKFSYTEDLSFFKIYNLKNSSQERGVEYCLNVKIFKDGKIDKSYITENDLKNETKYDLYKKVFSIYKSYFGKLENIDCVICYKNQFFIVASNKISALPDFEAQNYLKSIDMYLATPKKSLDPKKQNSEKENQSSKKINRKNNIIKAVWGSYYDLKTFFINNKLCFLPSPIFSVGVPVNLQNAPVGRYIIPKDFLTNKYDVEILFKNILLRDFGSQFLNNLKLPSTFFGVKLLNEYFAQIERENSKI